MRVFFGVSVIAFGHLARHDERSGVLIGAGGTWRSDWPRARVDCLRVRLKIDR